MTEGYYRVDLANWRLIILDGDDLSFIAPQNKEQKKERNAMVEELYERFHLNGMPWNGGIGRKQIKWLELQLDESEQTHYNVIVFCHFPLVSSGNHNLFNNQELIDILTQYPCVKAYFCGHYHAGNYQIKNGIHFVNFKGMVDTPLNAFSVVTLTSDSILIKGYGREPDRKLVIRHSTVEKGGLSK